MEVLDKIDDESVEPYLLKPAIDISLFLKFVKSEPDFIGSSFGGFRGIGPIEP